MTGEVIKSFLVGLGFDVDDASLKAFNASIKEASIKTLALGAAITGLTAAAVKNIADMSEGFEQMGYEFRIIAPAINKAIVLRREMLKAYSTAGINITKTVQASVKLNMSLAKTKFAMDAIYKSVGSKFFGLLTKQSDLFRDSLYKNMPKIQNALEKFVKFIFKAFEAVTTLGMRIWSILTRVWQFFVDLDKATGGWSTKILAVIAAWELLNLSFLATPLGMLIAGLTALLTLYDDYKTFTEGGKSFFDWGPYVPSLKAVGAIFDSILQVIKALAGLVPDLFSSDWTKNIADVMKVADAFAALNSAIEALIRSFKIDWVNKALDWRAKADSSIKNFFTGGGGNAAANVENNPVGKPLGNPAGNVANSQTNQHVNQQTNINVSSTADAHSVGKSVAGEQSRVNFDFTRNLTGAAK